jgi:uncharacterized membrane protein YeaQ/YmgE (transglycosylase-associated protein family)
MDPVNILVWIIVGGIAGWLASLVMRTNREQGLLEDIIIGIVGGLLAGFLIDVLDLGETAVSGLNLGSIFAAFIGAVILLAIIRAVRRT